MSAVTCNRDAPGSAMLKPAVRTSFHRCGGSEKDFSSDLSQCHRVRNSSTWQQRRAPPFPKIRVLTGRTVRVTTLGYSTRRLPTGENRSRDKITALTDVSTVKKRREINITHFLAPTAFHHGPTECATAGSVATTNPHQYLQ